jgi:hypothetical protein
MPRIQTKGVCQLCKGTFAKAAMTRHLQKCLAAHAESGTTVSKKKPKTGRLFHLLVQGKYNPFYWMHLEIPAKATLYDLDDFLRDIWLECCGHLSAFTIAGERYSAMADEPDPFGWDLEEQSIDVPVSDVFRPGLTFSYEYDFGSTTDLELRVLGEREGVVAKGNAIRVLARNEPPDLKCGHCGKPAAWANTFAEREKDFWLCEKCAKEDDEGLLPVVNSPRVGVCAYSG